MENTGVYRVKLRSPITMLIYIGLLMGLQISSLSRIYKFGNNKLSFVLISSVVIFLFICLLILIYRLFTIKRRIEVQFKPDSIVIGDNLVEANRIKTLYVRGYFKPLVGVKPKDGLFVPYKCCFSFLGQEQEDNGMKALNEWAELNQIKILHRNFSMWL